MKFSQHSKFPVALFVWAVIVGYPLAACADEKKGEKEKPVVVEEKGGKTEYKTITLDGSKDVSYKGIDQKKLRVDSSGSSDAKLTGKVEDLRVDISGSGQVDASDLEAETVDLTISGSGTVYVNATKEVTIHASGSCRIYVSGGGKVTWTKRSGSVKFYTKK